MRGDVELVLRARSGDGAASGDAYDRDADRIHDYGHSVLRDRHEAADTLGNGRSASGSLTVQTGRC
jgi:hypothetical protein